MVSSSYWIPYWFHLFAEFWAHESIYVRIDCSIKGKQYVANVASYWEKISINLDFFFLNYHAILEITIFLKVILRFQLALLFSKKPRNMTWDRK